MEKVLAKLILACMSFVIVIVISLVAMMWGWGLTPANWGWVCFGYVVLIIPAALGAISGAM